MTVNDVEASVKTMVNAIENEEGVFKRDVIALFVPVSAILAEGRPAPPDELAAATGRSTEDIVELIERTPELEIDRDNRVLGLGLTLLPTPHRIQLPGRRHLLYAWCVPDTLGAARILSESLLVTSPCPATGQPVAVEVEADRIAAADPPTAVMSWVTRFDPDDVRATACGHQNLFVSAQAAADYQAGYPHVVNVPVGEVFDTFGPVIDTFVERALAANAHQGRGRVGQPSGGAMCRG